MTVSWGGNMIRKALIGLAGLFLVLVAVVAGNTLTTRAPLPTPEPAATDRIGFRDQAALRLAEAVRFRTISYGPGAPVEAAAFDALDSFLVRSYRRVHAVLGRESVNRFSRLYRWQGSEPDLKPILLIGHLDVVPVEEGTEGDWSEPPFAGIVADGAIWGRGTLDDKPAVLGPLEAIEYLLGQGVARPKRTVYLAFGHDEELGGADGAGKIAALLAERGVRLAFTLDEGSIVAHDLVPGVDRPVALVGTAEKGYLSLELTARAEGGHSSMPPRTTAVGKLARAIDRLQTNPLPAALEPPASDMFEFLAPRMALPMRAVMANRWLFEPLIVARLEGSPSTNAMVRTTIAPTIVRGGVKDNVLPTEARGVINFRILPGETIASVIEYVRRTVDDPDVDVRPVGDGNEPSPVSDSGSASFAALGRTVMQVFPDVAVAPALVIAGTDSKHYVGLAENSYRFLPVRLGPKDLARFHGTDERITVESYAEVIRFYVRLLRNVAL